MVRLAVGALVSICLIIACKGEEDYITDENRLYSDLLITSSYNKYVRPVARAKDPIRMSFGFGITAIEDLDEAKQVLIMHGHDQLFWTDPRLAWNKTAYGGISILRIPASQIWLPDITVTNAAHSSYQSSGFDFTAGVHSNGMVTYFSAIRTETTCPLDMRDFPNDEHTCSLTFESLGGEHMNLSQFKTREPGHTQNLQAEHLAWELVDVSAELNTIYFDFAPTEGYSDITYTIKLRRRPGYLNHMFVAPAVVLALLIPVMFLLPTESGEKITMGTGIMVTFMLLMVMLESFVPTSHPKVPDIGVYYLACLVMVGLALGSSALIISIWYKSNRQKPLPTLAKQIFLSGLGKILCVSHDDFAVPGKYERKESFSASDGGSVDISQPSRETCHVSMAAEWRQLAVVLDRLCFVVFLVVMIVLTIVLVR